MSSLLPTPLLACPGASSPQVKSLLEAGVYLHRPMLVAVVEHVAEFARGAGMVGWSRPCRVCAKMSQALSAEQHLPCWHICAGGRGVSVLVSCSYNSRGMMEAGVTCRRVARWWQGGQRVIRGWPEGDLMQWCYCTRMHGQLRSVEGLKLVAAVRGCCHPTVIAAILIAVCRCGTTSTCWLC